MDLARAPVAAGLLARTWPLSRFLGYRPAPKPANLGAGTKEEVPSEATAASAAVKKVQALLSGQTERLLRVFVGAWLGLVLLALAGRTDWFVHGQGSESLAPPILVASFGAQSIVLFSTPAAPFAQPRHAVVGNTVAAAVGMSVSKLFALSPNFLLGSTVVDARAASQGGIAWVAGPTTAALAAVVLEALGMQHPPAGATALLAPTLLQLHDLSWWYVALIFVGSLIMLAVSLLVNNLGSAKYPTYWVSPTLFSDREHGTGVLLSKLPSAKSQSMALGSLDTVTEGEAEADVLPDELPTRRGRAPRNTEMGRDRSFSRGRSWSRAREWLLRGASRSVSTSRRTDDPESEGSPPRDHA